MINLGILPFIYIWYNEENEDNKNLICHEIFDLARISSGGLSPEEISEFIKRSNKLIANNMKID